MSDENFIQTYFPLQSVVFSASPDATIRVWSVTGGNCIQVVRAHEAGVTGLSLHATGDYLLSSSEDQVGFAGWTDLKVLLLHYIDLVVFFRFSTGPFLTFKLVESSPKSLMRVLAVVSVFVNGCMCQVSRWALIILLLVPQLSPVPSSTLMVSFLAPVRLTPRSRFGIWRSAPTWPTSRATPDPWPPLLSLRTDTTWPQVPLCTLLIFCFVLFWLCIRTGKFQTHF